MADQTLAQTGAVNPPAQQEPRKVSIIINNYNYGRFLRDAIDSALAQTYPNVEVIVVDDGSTDNSREIIASYGSRIIPVLKENGGQASAFNAGFAASTGDIIFFLDSDDALLPEAAETIVREWRDGVARIYFPLHVIDAEGRQTGELAGGRAIPDVRLGPFGVGSPTSGNAFWRAVLERTMPVPEAEWRLCAEGYLVLAAAIVGRSAEMPCPLGYYRIHGKNNFACAPPSDGAARRAIHAAFTLHRALTRLSGGKMPPFEDWVARAPHHWLARILSLRESPQDHPLPDTLPRLVRKALSATWRHPYWNFRRKLAYTFLVIGYSFSPLPVRRGLQWAECNAQKPIATLLLGRRSGELERSN